MSKSTHTSSTLLLIKRFVSGFDRKTETYSKNEEKVYINQAIAAPCRSLKMYELDVDLESYRTAIRHVWPSTGELSSTAIYAGEGPPEPKKHLPPGCLDRSRERFTSPLFAGSGVIKTH